MDEGQKQGGQGGADASQASKFVQGVQYPISKNDLVSEARQNGASEAVIGVLESLPDRQYSSWDEVSIEMQKPGGS